MPSLRERLEKRARQIELETDKLVESYTGELDAFLYKILSRFYAVKLTGIRGALKIKELPKVLAEEGLPEKIQGIAKGYSSKVENVKEDFAFFTTKGLDAVTKTIIVERVTANVLAIQNEVNSFVLQTQKAALSQVMTGQGFDFDKFSEIRQSPWLSKLTGQVTTDLDGFEREVGIALGQDLGFTHYYYAGTLIKTSRPFCIERAGRIYSIKEINSWDNGQGLPANVYLGGYNCRHRLSPVSDKQVKENQVIVYG
jgi:hypothetical protein